MEKKSIKLKTEFNTFAYYKPFGEFKFIHQTKSEINIFGSQVALCISSEEIDNYIWFGITNDIFNTKKTVYNFESDLTFLQKKELEEIENNFNLGYKDGFIFKDKNRYNILTLLFQNYLRHNYIMICSSRKSREPQSLSEDMFGDDILYIHGIWEVELTDLYISKIYGI